MRVLRLAILIALVASEAQAQQRIPSVVRAAIEENRKACEPDKFATDTGFLTRRDVNADGIDDFILDYGKAACGDSTSYFCGSAGCVTQVFVSLPQGEYTKVLDENVRGLRFQRVKGRPAMMLGLHGSACGRSGAAPCNATLFWNGLKFSPAN